MPDTMLNTPAIVSPTGMPAEIARAIGEVMTQIKTLPKSEHNDHGGYGFASIDAFLAAVGPLCASVGLIVLQDEDNIDLLERAGKTWVKITYSFSLAHVSGVLWDRSTRRTVFQRVDGPQTTGGTQSYAMKMYLRSLFAIPTGDQDDPDFHPKEVMGARQDSPERAQRSRRPDAAPERTEASRRPSGGPEHIAIPTGDDGLKIGTWTRMAMDALAALPNAEARREWLELHPAELADVRRLKPEYANKIEGIAIAPDRPEVAA